MIYGITLIILSLLAVPSLLANKPGVKKLLDQIAPYQGWIGLVFCFWGIWGIIDALIHIGLIGTWPIWWITWLACSLIEAILGFILGYGMINKLVLKDNETAKQKAEALLAKLTPIQGKLGIFGIIVGLWVIVYRIIFF